MLTDTSGSSENIPFRISQYAGTTITGRDAKTPRSSTYVITASPRRVPDMIASPVSLNATPNTAGLDVRTAVALIESVAIVSFSTTVTLGSLRTTTASAANDAHAAASTISIFAFILMSPPR